MNAVEITIAKYILIVLHKEIFTLNVITGKTIANNNYLKHFFVFLHFSTSRAIFFFLYKLCEIFCSL